MYKRRYLRILSVPVMLCLMFLEPMASLLRRYSTRSKR